MPVWFYILRQYFCSPLLSCKPASFQIVGFVFRKWPPDVQTDSAFSKLGAAKLQRRLVLRILSHLVYSFKSPVASGYLLDGRMI